MTSDYIDPVMFDHLLAALMPENRLALQISLATGLRIGDVLALKTEDVRKGRFTVTESKTGKKRRIKLPEALITWCLHYGGKVYVFEHRYDYKRHRTRQAVYKDLHRAADLFRCKSLTVAPHSARKIFAVQKYHKYGDVKKVQQLLNHSDEAVTMLYAMADELTARSSLARARRTTEKK